MVSFAQFFLAPAARQEFACYFFFRPCGADAFTFVILLFSSDAARPVAALTIVILLQFFVTPAAWQEFLRLIVELFLLI